MRRAILGPQRHIAPQNGQRLLPEIVAQRQFCRLHQNGFVLGSLTGLAQPPLRLFPQAQPQQDGGKVQLHPRPLIRAGRWLFQSGAEHRLAQ